MGKTYGELVGQLIEQGTIRLDEETILRRVYGLVPLNEDGTTELRICGDMPELDREYVSRHVDLLKNGGLVSTGKGRSRGVWRNFPKYGGERDLYPHMRAEIRTRWADESPHDYIEPDRFCEVLATHGAKRGRWNAPDITLIGGKTLPFLPGKFLDVVTFEVKQWLDITGLYEALSHRTHATHAYLLCCNWPKPWSEPDAGEVGRITREAVRTGVGFILARQPDDYATWEEIAPATRWTPDPELLHEFVADQDQNTLRKLRRWLRQDPFYGTRSRPDFAALGLNEEDQLYAEDIYLEISRWGSVGWKHFEGWIDKEHVERIRQRLKEAGIIRVVRKGGMRLPDD